MSLGLIVEGQTEEAALPVLLRRIAEEDGRFVDVPKPFRVKRGQIVQPGQIERSIERLMQSRVGLSGILLLIDEDDDSWDKVEPDLQVRGEAASPVPFRAVVAVREFEAWMLAAKSSLRGVRGIRETAEVPAEGPERMRDAAGRLTSNMDGDRRYIKVDDAPAFVARLDLAMARENSASFRRFCDAFDALTRPA